MHLTTMPDSWDCFGRHIQNLFAKMPSADDQSDHLVNALLSQPQSLKKFQKKELYSRLNMLFKPLGLGRSL